MKTKEKQTLRDQIQIAHVAFVRTTSRLLECAEAVKAERDRLLMLLERENREHAGQGAQL